MLLCGRSDKRLSVAATVHLKGPGRTERGISENVSARGLRVLTKRRWKIGAELEIALDHNGFQATARVVYCQPGPSQNFYVGLELEGAADSFPVSRGATSPTRPAVVLLQSGNGQK
jgi:hypothetical protein